MRGVDLSTLLFGLQRIGGYRPHCLLNANRAHYLSGPQDQMAQTNLDEETMSFRPISFFTATDGKDDDVHRVYAALKWSLTTDPPSSDFRRRCAMARRVGAASALKRHLRG